MKPEEPVVAVDTREQKPYSFPRYELKALPAGDYSLVGYEDQVAVERKTKADAYASLGRERARFKREFERLAALRYAAVVIEASLEDFLHPPPFTQMNPKAAVNTLIGWSVKYRVCVFFAGGRATGKAVTYRILEKYLRYALER
jgi:DNA excision repair protein ERCC-4